MLDLARVYAIKLILEDSGAIYATGFLSSKAHVIMQTAVDKVISSLRPQLIPLAESVYITDNYHPSSIGNSYGDIYEK